MIKCLNCNEIKPQNPSPYTYICRDCDHYDKIKNNENHIDKCLCMKCVYDDLIKRSHESYLSDISGESDDSSIKSLNSHDSSDSYSIESIESYCKYCGENDYKCKDCGECKCNSDCACYHHSDND